jgi:hypothetical protein
MAPPLLAAFGSQRERASEVQILSGIAPVSESSGKSSCVHFRFACPKFLAELSRVCRLFHPPVAMGARLLQGTVSARKKAPRGGAGVSLQMDSRYLSLLDGAGGVRRERLPGGLGQAQLAAGRSNQSGGIVTNGCENCGRGGEFSRG